MPSQSVVVLMIISAACALGVCALRVPIARTMNLLDVPDMERKRHAAVTPVVGGLAAFPGIAMACIVAVSLGASDAVVAILNGVVFGFFLIGYADDLTQIRPTRRLLLSLAMFGGLILVPPNLMPPAFTFGGLAIPIGAGAVAMLAIIASAGALNAINMADGQDGLCSGLLLIWLVFMALTLDPPYAAAAAISGSAMAVVLVYNLFSKVFLGDLGAYGVGAFAVGLMLIGIASGRIDHGQVVALLTVPVLDCIWLMIERKRRRRSPFDPDRQHLHHILDFAVGRWTGLSLYLGIVACGAAAAALGGWSCVASIVGQAAFVTFVRLRASRAPDPIVMRGPATDSGAAAGI